MDLRVERKVGGEGIMGMGEERGRIRKEERSSSFLGRLEKENLARRERSLEAEVEMMEEEVDLIDEKKRKAFPKILRYKYFKEERLERIRSERNVLKVQAH